MKGHKGNSRQRNPLGITEITIQGPFERYGRFTPEAFGRKHTVKTASDFKLLSFGISRGTYHNRVGISYTFAGRENPNRIMRIMLTIYDKEGTVIGQAESTCSDPRISAREWNSEDNVFRGTFGHREPSSSLGARLADGKGVSHICRIEIFAIEVKNP